MHYANVDLGLASLGTNRRENFFVMDFPIIRLNAHAQNVFFSVRRCLCYTLTMWCDPSDYRHHTCRPLLSHQNFV